jgi:hypothetical protein
MKHDYSLAQVAVLYFSLMCVSSAFSKNFMKPSPLRSSLSIS